MASGGGVVVGASGLAFEVGGVAVGAAVFGFCLLVCWWGVEVVAVEADAGGGHGFLWGGRVFFLGWVCFFWRVFCGVVGFFLVWVAWRGAVTAHPL